MTDNRRTCCDRCAQGRASRESGRTLLYHQPDTFAFWWLRGKASPSGTAHWLLQESIRFPFCLLDEPAQTGGAFGANEGKACACGDARASEIGCCQVWLEVSRRYFCYKAGGAAALACGLPDDRCMRATLTRRQSELAQVFVQTLRYRGDGMAAALFFEAKACEVIAYLLETLTLLCPGEWAGENAGIEDRLGIERVTVYLNAHMDQDLPMDTLCELACMGKTKLKQAFRDSHNCTLSEYLTERRIEEAQRLLRETNLAISEIAQTVGYLAGGRFAMLFKQRTGYLPSEYRGAFR